MLSPIRLSISRKLADKDYRHRFFLGRAQDEIASQLREWRHKRGSLTQRALADLCGMKQSAISRIEKASYSSWSFKTLWRIAKELDLRVKIVFEPMEAVIGEYQEKEDLVLHRQEAEMETRRTYVVPAEKVDQPKESEVPFYTVTSTLAGVSVGAAVQGMVFLSQPLTWTFLPGTVPSQFSPAVGVAFQGAQWNPAWKPGVDLVVHQWPLSFFTGFTGEVINTTTTEKVAFEQSLEEARDAA